MLLALFASLVVSEVGLTAHIQPWSTHAYQVVLTLWPPATRVISELENDSAERMFCDMVTMRAIEKWKDLGIDLLKSYSC